MSSIWRSVWKSGGQIPWNAIAICEMQDVLAEEKTPCERRYGEPFKGTVIPFGAMVISLRDQSRIHQFGKKVLLSLKSLDRGWNLERRFQTWKIWKSWSHQKFVLKELTRKTYWWHNKGDEFKFPVADGSARLSGTDYKERRFQWRTST